MLGNGEDAVFVDANGVVIWEDDAVVLRVGGAVDTERVDDAGAGFRKLESTVIVIPSKMTIVPSERASVTVPETGTIPTELAPPSVSVQVGSPPMTSITSDAADSSKEALLTPKGSAILRGGVKLVGSLVTTTQLALITSVTMTV